MTHDDEIAKLRRSTVRNQYLNEPSQNEIPNFSDELEGILKRIDDGEQSKTVGVRDQSIMALLVVLDEQDGLVEFGNQLQQVLSRELTDDLTRSDVMRLLIRVGLREGAPNYLEQLQKAKAEYASQNI